MVSSRAPDWGAFLVASMLLCCLSLAEKLPYSTSSITSNSRRLLAHSSPSRAAARSILCVDTYASCPGWGPGQCATPGVATYCPCMCGGPAPAPSPSPPKPTCVDTYPSCSGWGPSQCGTPGVATYCPCMCGGSPPTPSPAPKPSPSPAPKPTPSPSPKPAPTPSPGPKPSPSPAPKPVPSPSPAPKPVPSPSPAPKPVPSPSPAPKPSPKPSGPLQVFSPYKDVTVAMNWNTNEMGTQVRGSQEAFPGTAMPASANTITLAFATGECGSENWGGVPGQTWATANIPKLQAAGKYYIVSTGGAAGSFTCGSSAGFTTFLNRYMSPYLVGIDFDIEVGQSSAQITDLVSRAKEASATYPNMRFSFTLAVLPSGLPPGQTGDTTVKIIQSSGLTNYYVNLMTMDYGAGGCAIPCNMGQAANNAATAVKNTYGIPYSRIEVTPMIGGNDDTTETFTLTDVVTVSNFAKANGLGGIHWWSFDRDRDCPPGSASATCNTYNQAGTLGFLNSFVSNLPGWNNYGGSPPSPVPPPPPGPGPAPPPGPSPPPPVCVDTYPACPTWVGQCAVPGVATYCPCMCGGGPPAPSPGPSPPSPPPPSPKPPGPTPNGNVIYSGSTSATYYYDLRTSCNGETYAENDGYPYCTSTNPAFYQTLRQLGSNNVVAIDANMLAGNKAGLCGKLVRVYRPDGTEVPAPDGGNFFVWDGCAACVGGGRLDFSLSGARNINSNACTLGVIPGVRYEIYDTQVKQFTP